MQLLKESALSVDSSISKIMLTTAFGRLSNMFLSRLLTGFLWGSTAFKQIVRRVHDNENVGNHWSRLLVLNLFVVTDPFVVPKTIGDPIVFLLSFELFEILFVQCLVENAAKFIVKGDHRVQHLILNCKHLFLMHKKLHISIDYKRKVIYFKAISFIASELSAVATHKRVCNYWLCFLVYFSTTVEC